MNQTEIIDIHTYDRIVANEVNKSIRHCRIGKVQRKLPTNMGKLFPAFPKGQPLPPYEKWPNVAWRQVYCGNIDTGP